MGEFIIEFNDEISANSALSTFNEVAIQYWSDQGYAIIETESGKAVVGKNALTGEDNLSALTLTWDELKESPDGTFYFTSPTPDPRFKDWRDYMPDGVDLGAEREMPEEWIEENAGGVE